MRGFELRQPKNGTLLRGACRKPVLLVSRRLVSRLFIRRGVAHQASCCTLRCAAAHMFAPRLRARVCSRLRAMQNTSSYHTRWHAARMSSAPPSPCLVIAPCAERSRHGHPRYSEFPCDSVSMQQQSYRACTMPRTAVASQPAFSYRPTSSRLPVCQR